MRTAPFLVLLASIALPTQAQSVHGWIESLDGRITASERKAATDSLREGATLLLMRREGDVFWIAVESEAIEVASLCVAAGGTVSVLHASAAVGALTFAPSETGWTTNERFEWALRDTTRSEAARAARLAYHSAHGWVASTTPMGEPGHVEFLLHHAHLPHGELRVAVGIMSHDAVFGLPAGAEACASGDLVRGMEPSGGLSFDPSRWHILAAPVPSPASAPRRGH